MINYQNEKELKQIYLELKSIRKVGLYYNVSPLTIKYWLQKFNIPNIITHKSYNFTKDELIVKYNELKTISLVAKYYNIPASSMKFLFNKFNIDHLSKHKNNFNESFFKYDNANSFYLAGFLAADGNIEKNSTRITLVLAEKDLLFLNKIKEMLEFNGNLRKVISHDSKRNIKWKDSIGYSLRFSSRKVINDLKRFNIVPHKTKIYDFPEWLINHPLVNHFMRGYFDGDGCARVGQGQLTFSLVGNLSFLQIYQNILEKQCQIKHNNIYKDKNIYILKYCGNLITPKIYSYLYNNSAFHLDRKYEFYRGFINND